MGQTCSKNQIRQICLVLLRPEERRAMVARGRQTTATFEGWGRRRLFQGLEAARMWRRNKDSGGGSLLKGKREQGGAATLWRGMKGDDVDDVVCDDVELSTTKATSRGEDVAAEGGGEQVKTRRRTQGLDGNRGCSEYGKTGMRKTGLEEEIGIWGVGGF